MAKHKRKKRIFSHARMLTIETILLVGLMQVWFEEWLVGQSGLPGWLKILTLMVIMIGILGFLLVSIEQLTKKSLAHAHDVAKNMPIPWSMVLVHIAAFVGLFYLYGLTYKISWLP